MSTRSTIGIENDDGTVTHIYCHFDGSPEGYPDCVGQILRNHYTDAAKVRALMELGNLSSLGREIGTAHDWTDRGTAQCHAYGRDRGEAEQGAQVSPNAAKYIRTNYGTDYTYLFRGGAWWVRCESGEPLGGGGYAWVTVPRDTDDEAEETTTPPTATTAAATAPAVPAPTLEPLPPPEARNFWRVVADDGRTYSATVEDTTALDRCYVATLHAGKRSATKRGTTARRAVCLAAMELGLGVEEIRAPGTLTRDEMVAQVMGDGVPV